MTIHDWLLIAAAIFFFLIIVFVWVMIRGPLDDDHSVLPKCFGRKPIERRRQENTGCPQCPYYSSCGYRPRNGG